MAWGDDDWEKTLLALQLGAADRVRECHAAAVQLLIERSPESRSDCVYDLYRREILSKAEVKRLLGIQDEPWLFHEQLQEYLQRRHD